MTAQSFVRYSIRIALFAAVVYMLVHRLDARTLKRVLQKIDWVWVLAAAVCYYFKSALQAARWKTACMAHNRNLSFFNLLCAQVEIAFLEILFPLPDSEDAFRIINMVARKITISESTLITIYDRVVGVVMVLAIVPLSLAFFTESALRGYVLHTNIILVFLLLALTAATAHRIILHRLIEFTEIITGKRIKILATFKEELQKPIKLKFVIASVMLAFIYALCSTLVPWLLLKSAGGYIGFIVLLAGVPLFYISAVLPLSLQGLGLYEATVVFILQQCAVPTETATAVGVVHFALNLCVISTGGIIHLLNPEKTNLEAAITGFGKMVFGRKANSSG